MSYPNAAPWDRRYASAEFYYGTLPNDFLREVEPRLMPGGWDAIVSIWCHLPAANRPGLHRRIVDALKPGGLFVLEAYRPEQLQFGTGGPPTVDLLPTLAELQQDFAALELEIAQAPERDVREGRGHDGMSAVVEMVARKRASSPAGEGR